MEKLTPNFKHICLSLLILISASAFGNKAKGDEAESILALSAKFEEAIDQRHYNDARNTIAEIIPLMKKDIKHSKKEMSAIEDESEKAEFQADLKRKGEIYQATKKIYDTSAAAIRVKGKDMVEMLNAYADLVE